MRHRMLPLKSIILPKFGGLPHRLRRSPSWLTACRCRRCFGNITLRRTWLIERMPSVICQSFPIITANDGKHAGQHKLTKNWDCPAAQHQGADLSSMCCFDRYFRSYTARLSAAPDTGLVKLGINIKVQPKIIPKYNVAYSLRFDSSDGKEIIQNNWHIINKHNLNLPCGKATIKL